jgi:hypothetical protein
MTWIPYTMDELDHLLKSEQANFSADEQAKFNRNKVPIRKVRCIRSPQHADDGLFVIASDRQTAVIFDDVDQEFGICKAKALDDGPVRDWGLAGSLVFALMHLK